MMDESEIYDYFRIFASISPSIADIIKRSNDKNEITIMQDKRILDLLCDGLRAMRILCDARGISHYYWYFDDVASVINQKFVFDETFCKDIESILDDIGRPDLFMFIINGAKYKIISINDEFLIKNDPFEYVYKAIELGLSGIYKENGIIYTDNGSVNGNVCFGRYGLPGPT